MRVEMERVGRNVSNVEREEEGVMMFVWKKCTDDHPEA